MSTSIFIRRQSESSLIVSVSRYMFISMLHTARLTDWVLFIGMLRAVRL